MDETSGKGVKGLLSRFENAPNQQGQKPEKKPKPAVISSGIKPKPVAKEINNRTDFCGKTPVIIPRVGQQPKSNPTQLRTRIVVMYQGKELPQEFTTQNGQVYQLREMPIVNGPAPDKPPRPHKDDDDEEYGDVEAVNISAYVPSGDGIRRNQGVPDGFKEKNQGDNESIYEAYGDVLSSGTFPRDSQISEIYEDISALSPSAM